MPKVGEYDVPANVQWYGTGVHMNAADLYRVQVLVGPGWPTWACSAALPDCDGRGYENSLEGQTDAWQLKGVNTGALVGRVENNGSFLVGNNGSCPRQTGQLFLACNDGDPGNNPGHLHVVVSVEPGAPTELRPVTI